MGSGISNRNKTTWPNTDNRLKSKEFYEPGINRGIAIRATGEVEAFNDCMRHISQVGELKHEAGIKEAITELESLMRGRHIANNSEDNSEISGSLYGRIVKTWIYGKGMKSTVYLEIAKIKKALSDCPQTIEAWGELERKAI